MIQLPRYTTERCGDGVMSQHVSGGLVVCIGVVNTSISVSVVKNPGIGMNTGMMSSGVSRFMMNIGELVMSISEFVLSISDLMMNFTYAVMNMRKLLVS